MNKIYNKNTFMLLIVIAAISINLRLGITSIGPLMDTIRTSLSLSNAQASLLTTVPVLCMGIFASLATVLNKKLGAKLTLCFMLVLMGIATAVRGFIPGFSTLLITAFLIGLSIAVLGPTMSSIIKKNFPGHAAIAIGISTFFMSMGSAASAGLTGMFFNWTESYSYALGIWSLAAVVGIVAIVCILKDMPWGPQKESEKPKVSYNFPSPWKQVTPWLFMLFYAFQAAIYFSTITWLVPMSVENGMTLVQGGLLLSAVMSVQVIFNLLLPILMEKFPARKYWIYFILIAGIAATMLFWTGDHTLMWLGAFMMGIPLGGLYSAALMLPLDETVTSEGANSWTAMMQTGGCIIGGLFPFAIGWIYDATENHNYTLAVLTAVYISMFILITIIGNKKEKNYDQYIVKN